MKKMLKAGLFAAIAVAVALASALIVSPAKAVEPDEMLQNSEMEARARSISAGLRCLVCQNQSIDDSNAGLARDLRVLVRERLTRGDTDEQAVEFIVARYGEFVLLQPRLSPHNYLLWFAPAALLLLGIFMTRKALSGGKARAARVGEPQALSAEEEARLDEILGKK